MYINNKSNTNIKINQMENWHKKKLRWSNILNNDINKTKSEVTHMSWKDMNCQNPEKKKMNLHKLVKELHGHWSKECHMATMEEKSTHLLLAQITYCFFFFFEKKITYCYCLKKLAWLLYMNTIIYIDIICFCLVYMFGASRPSPRN